MRVTPTTEQQLSSTVWVKNCGVTAVTPGTEPTASADEAGRYTFTGSAQNSTSEALPEAPADSTIMSAPKRSRDSRTPSSSDATTTSDAASANTATNAMNAVSTEEPRRRVMFLHAR